MYLYKIIGYFSKTWKWIGNKKRSTASGLIFSFMPLFRARKRHNFTANVLSYKMYLLKNFKRMWNQTNIFKVAREIFLSRWKHSTFPPQAHHKPFNEMHRAVGSDAAFLTDGITHTKRLDKSIQGPWPREVPYALPFTIPEVNMQQQAQDPESFFFYGSRQDGCTIPASASVRNAELIFRCWSKFQPSLSSLQALTI